MRITYRWGKLSQGPESRAQKPIKFFLENGPPITGGTFGPGRLESSGFRSQTSAGTTYWYYSQAPDDFDYPPASTPTPESLGIVYLHRNTSDGGYQLWVWQQNDGGLCWRAVSLDPANRTFHPLIGDRVLHLTTSAKPSWVLSSTKTTYGTRHGDKIRSSTPRGQSSSDV